jgi:hypothetical protein
MTEGHYRHLQVSERDLIAVYQRHESHHREIQPGMCTVLDHGLVEINVQRYLRLWYSTRLAP